MKEKVKKGQTLNQLINTPKKGLYKLKDNQVTDDFNVLVISKADSKIYEADKSVFSSGDGGGIESIVAGTNVTVDDTDPQNPIISATGGGSSSLFPNGFSEETVSRELTSADIGKLLIIVNDGVILTPASDMAATGDLPKGFGIWCLNPTTKTSGFKVNPPSTNIYLESTTAFDGAIGAGQIVSFMTLYDDDLLTTNIFPLTDIMLYDEFTGTVGQLAIPYLLENLGFRGTATLSSGTVTVLTDKIKTGYKIYVSVNTPSGTQGFLSAPTGSIVDATSFVINSTNAGDNSTVNWWIAP